MEGSVPIDLVHTSLKNLYLGNNKGITAIPLEILNSTSIERIALYNTSINENSIPDSVSSVIVEPCIICNGGEYRIAPIEPMIEDDHVAFSESCDKNVTEMIINNNDFEKMLTRSECRSLIKRCIHCLEVREADDDRA